MPLVPEVGGLARRVARATLPRTVRNWLRDPGQTARWVMDEVRFRAGRPATVLLPDGRPLRCHPAAARMAFVPTLADAEQRSELAAFLAAIGHAGLVFDIGAHFGLFSLAATVRRPDVRVVAVDASPAAARMLARQATANGVHSRITVEQAAVGAAPGWTELVDVGVLAAGYYTGPSADHPTSERERVPTITVDDLTRRHGAPTVLKVDIEGHELDALRGSEATLAGARPLIALELHGDLIRRAGGNPSAVLDVLARCGYRLRTSAGDPLDPKHAAAAPLIRLMAVPA